MPYDPAIPAASDSPSVFPAQSQTNFSRLQTLVGADHQFNLSAAADDGYHNLIHMTQQAPAGALAATGRLYAKSSGGKINLFYMNEAGTGYQITPCLPIRAAVNFVGNGAVGACVVRSSYNVDSLTGVQKTDVGRYTITFTSPMPDNNYIVHITGMRNSDDPLQSFVLGNAAYGTSVSTNFIKIGFGGSVGDARDVLMGSVTIFSVT